MIDYSNCKAVSGVIPLISNDYAAWVEIRPAISGSRFFDPAHTRIIVQEGEEKTVIVEQVFGDEKFVSTHTSPESAGCYIGGYYSREIGEKWDSKLQQEIVGVLSEKKVKLNQQLDETNEKIQIKDDFLTKDLSSDVYRHLPPSCRVVIGDRKDNQYFFMLIMVSESDIEVIQYEGKKHVNKWRSVYTDYQGTLRIRNEENDVIKHDVAVWQVVSAMSLTEDKSLKIGDIHDLSRRVFFAKKNYRNENSNSISGMPSEEYHWSI